MQTSTSGLKTLNDRVSALETQTGTAVTSFAEQLISSTTSNLKSDLQKIFQFYENGLKGLGINLENIQLSDLVKIVPYTVTFVEANMGTIAATMKKDITSGLKLQTALTFIKQYFPKEEEFVISFINHTVDVLFNSAKNTLSDVLPNTKSSKVSPPATGTVSKKSGKKKFFF